jgi:hypothetical protein
MQYYQDKMNREQMTLRLTNEIYKIQMQIQQISYGSYGGGYSNGGIGQPTGTVIDPVTGQIISNPGYGGGDPNLGPIPSRGR